MEPLETTHSIPQWMADELGLLMPSPLEQLEEIEGPYNREYYQEVFSKGYYRNPYDENGEISF